MATTLRKGSTIIRRKGSVDVQFVGAGFEPGALKAELISADGQNLDSSVHRDGPHHRLTEWRGEAVLGVAISGVFASPTMLGCLLTIRSADGFINELVLQPVDVSALPASELVRFTDLGDKGWGISAVATAPPLPTPPWNPPSTVVGKAIPPARQPVGVDAPPVPPPTARLADPFGDAARDAARTRIGRSRVSEDDRRNLHVLVDISASMLAFERSGALQQLLNVLGGINEVHGRSLELTVWAASPLVAAQPHRVTRAQSQHLAAGLFAAQGVTSSSGVASAYRQAQHPQGWTIVISDCVPPDLLQELSPAGDEMTPRLVAFAQSRFDYRAPPLESWREQLASAQPAVEQGLLSVTSIDPTVGALTADGCEALVASLVAGLPTSSAVAR
jgi:hypothetical protein